MTRTHAISLVLGLCLLMPLAAVAEETQQETSMSPEQMAMMAAWQKAGALGEAHAKLAKQAGTWKSTVTGWMEPGAEPMVSDGVFHRELILGGRVLQESYDGSFAGMPFKGFGLTGYDNVTGRWWSTWSDDMSTGLMVMWGEWSDEKQGVVYHGKSPDPMTGEMVESMTIVRQPKDGQEVMEMYDMRTGEPVKTMEIASTRQ